MYDWGTVHPYPSLFGYGYAAGLFLDQRSYSFDKPKNSISVFMEMDDAQLGQIIKGEHQKQYLTLPKDTVITVKLLDGHPKEFKCSLQWSFGLLRTIVAELSGLCTPQIRLVFRGAPCNDGQTLSQGGVVQFDTIHAILQIMGS